jgi:hypothetical protein
MYGKEVWRFQTEKTQLGDSCSSVYNGILYFGSEEGNIYALNAKTGEEVWRFKTNGPTWAGAVLENGVVYFGSWDCHLYAVDAKTGEEVWRFTTSTTVPATEDVEEECPIELVIKPTKSELEKEKDKYHISILGPELFGQYKSESPYKTKSAYKTKSEYK